MARKRTWSYLSGERGRNRVRVFEKRPGQFFAEWTEDGKKKRALLRGVHHPDEAKKKADEIAAEFGRLDKRWETPTLLRLMQTYLKEVSVTKGKSKRSHDHRAVRVWFAFFDAQPGGNRKSDRDPSTLDRKDWDGFLMSRRAGAIPGWPRPVRDRQVEYDLAFLVAVLNWATGRRENGTPLLATNPWRAELRRSQRWGFPREKNPLRPAMTPELREGLLAHAPSWQFGLALLLQRATRRRNSSIRQLLWSDIDQEEWTIRWREETDKSGTRSCTPIMDRNVIDALKRAPSRGIGSTPVFPSATDPTRPTGRNTFQIWLRRSKDRWLRSVPDAQRGRLRAQLRGVGFHSEKRAGVRDPEFRALPPAIQEAWAATRYETLRTVYDEVTVDDIREAVDAHAPAVTTK